MRSLAVLAAAGAAAAPWLPRRLLLLAPRPGFLGRLAAGTALAGVTGATAAALVGSGPLVPAAAVLAAPIPAALVRARRLRHRERSLERWPDFLAAVRSRIAGGAPLPEATRAAARHLGGLFDQLDVGAGLPFDRVMEQARRSWADPLGDRVLTTLAVAAEIGGAQVDRILAALADSVADELRLRRAHHAALTQQRLTAAVALVAPWALLGLSLATNPTAADAFATPTGTAIIGGGLVATVSGYLLTRRAARLSAPPRLFSDGAGVDRGLS